MSEFYSEIFGDYVAKNRELFDSGKLSHAWSVIQLAYLIHINNVGSNLNMLIARCNENYQFISGGILSFSFVVGESHRNVVAKSDGEKWTILS